MAEYDDFYEPSDFDIQVEEFKNTLRSSVKKEYTDRIAQLEEELKEFREMKEKKWDYEQELESKKRYFDVEIEKMKEEMKRTILGRFVDEITKTFWKADGHSEYLFPKCDRCDNKRQFHFKSPFGREMTEPCKCAKEKYIYKPKEIPVMEFCIDTSIEKSRYSKNKKDYTLWFSFVDNWDEKIQYRRIENLWDDSKSYEEWENKIGYYDPLMFKTKEECLKYCEWKNNKE